jgi:diacylglycerol kinase family enzyme
LDVGASIGREIDATANVRIDNGAITPGTDRRADSGRGSAPTAAAWQRRLSRFRCTESIAARKRKGERQNMRRRHRPHVVLPPATRPERPVLFYNPRSGGGKAVRFALAAEAKARGIEPVELVPGENMAVLVRDAVSRGADALAMAGGDGSQAIVASIASEHSLPYACIPAGTRNHFARDLGVDPDDVVGALDAFVGGAERAVDLADVNGRVFVNNVSLGIYGKAVQRPEYRNAKLRTLLQTIPRAVGPRATEAQLSWTEPDGRHREGRPGMMISNNPYRLDEQRGPCRPRLDEGLLGVVVLPEPPQPVREWTAASFSIEAGSAVAAGVDGEAAILETPLQFRTRPGALKVRISWSHPGTSPSAIECER